MLIFLLALGVRVWFLYDISDSPTFSVPIVDSMEYDQMARDLEGGGGLDLRFFWQPVFYPLFLGGVYALSGGSILTALVVQAIVGAMMCVLVWRIGVRVFGPAAGWIGAGMVMMNPVLLFFESQLLATGWAVFWSAGLILALLRAAERATWGRVLIVGVVGAMSILTRPVFVPFIVMSSAWLILRWVRDKIALLQIIRGAAIGIVGALMVLAPVGVMSYRVLGTVRLLPYSRGINLYIGNNAAYRDTISIRPGGGWDTLTREPIRAGYIGPFEGERYFLAKSKTYCREHPMLFVRGLAEKGLAFFSSRELARNVDIHIYRQWSEWLKVGVWKAGGFGFPFGVLLPLAGVGLWLGRRTLPGVIWWFVMFYPAAVILVFVSSRYRAPFLPIVTVLAAGGVVKLIELTKRKTIPEKVISIIIFSVLVLVNWLSGPFAGEGYDYLPELYYCRADSLAKQGHPSDAEASYREAIRLKRDYIEAYRNLGLLLENQGQSDRAIEQFRAGLENGGENPGLYVDWGRALLAKNDVTGAIKQFEKSLAIDPNYGKGHASLAEGYHRLGERDLAEQHGRRAVELDGSDPASHIMLGTILTGDRPGEALEQFTAASKLPIDQPVLMMNLANGFARLKAFDQASVIYRLAIRQQPGDGLLYYNYGACLKEQGDLQGAEAMLKESIVLKGRSDLAYVLLGEIYTEQGDRERARACYEKVLSIDPGNEDAQKALKR